MKIVVSNPETGKSYQKELEASQEKTVHGKRIGDPIKGDTLGLVGYELELTGGSDQQGFPMRVDLHGTSRKRLLLSGGPGYKAKRKGERKRKSIRGNTFANDIAQVNLKVVKTGKDKLEKLFGKAEEKPKEEKAKENPKEEKAKGKKE